MRSKCSEPTQGQRAAPPCFLTSLGQGKGIDSRVTVGFSTKGIAYNHYAIKNVLKKKDQVVGVRRQRQHRHAGERERERETRRREGGREWCGTHGQRGK